MPKPKRVKNLHKGLVGSSSKNAPSVEPCSHPVQSPLPSAPIFATSQQSVQGTTFAQSCTQASAEIPPSEPSTQCPSSQPSNQISSSQPSSASKRKSNHYWLVDSIDEQGRTKKMKVNVRDVHNLAEGTRILVDFNEQFLAIGEAAGLLAGVCGQLASNPDFFPISFEKWSLMPKSFFEDKFNNVIKRLFYFKVDERHVRRFVDHSINKKWREYRIKLWNEFYDPTKSRDELINNHPENINIDQWATFVDYRLDVKTQELCKRNQEIRKKQIIPHTCGAKSIARRRAEMLMDTGRNIGRGEMWNLIHKKKDGSYITDDAREIGEQIEEYMTQSLGNSSEISPTDALGAIFGKEHPGRVRGLGMGAIPSIAFGHTTTRLGSINLGLSGASSSSTDNQVQQKMIEIESTLQALITYINDKDGGTIPDAIVRYCNNRSQAADLASGTAAANDSNNPNLRSSDGSNTQQSAGQQFPSPN